MSYPESAKAKRERFEKLQTRLHDLRSGLYMGKINHDVKDKIMWFTQIFFKLPEVERQELRDAWNEYHKRCAETPESALYREMGNAFRDKNTKRIKELQKQARQMLKNGIETIDRPRGFDPLIWNNADWAINFRQVERELKFAGINDDGEFEQRTNTW